MKTAIYQDRMISDAERRARLYAGHLFLYSPLPAARELCDFAARMVKEAFAPLDPELAQHELEVERFVAILAELKPAFIHHPECKRLIRELILQLGGDSDDIYFDVPRLRTAAAGDYLNSGIAYAFHPHRDTWYSASHAQINWWLPIFPIGDDNGMAFHTHYFDRPVENSSESYDYYRWNAESRANAAQHVKADTRIQPRPARPLDPDPQLTLVPEAGGLILFSAAQLHSTIPNSSGRTRFSIDFRTVSRIDIEARREAANLDARCTGSSLRDFLRLSDLSRLPEVVVVAYSGPPPDGAQLIYQPK